MTVERVRIGRAGALAHWGPIPEAELTPMVRARLATLAGEVETLKRDLETARDRLKLAEQEADQDQLLPVLNRRAFVRELSRHISSAARYGTPASLVYFDLDGFKQINDSFGHAAGDAVLTHFANVLCDNVRDSDVVGRIGGDEFAIILAHATEEQANKKVGNLTNALSKSPPKWNGRHLAIGFSFGAFELSPSDDTERAMARADEAMYANKRGRARA